MHPKSLRHFVCCGLFPVFIFASSLKVLAATKMVKDINPGGNSGIEYLTNVEGTLFFRAYDGIHGHELWKSDRTESGTVMVKDLRSGDSDSSSFPGPLLVMDDTLFLSAMMALMVKNFGDIDRPLLQGRTCCSYLTEFSWE